MQRKISIFCRGILALAAVIALQAQAAADARYMVYLNPFEVQKYEQEAMDAGYVRPQIPDTLTEEERTEYIARNIDALIYSPGVERLRSELIEEFSLHDADKTIFGIPAFFARLNETQVAALNASARIVSITKIDDKEESSINMGIGMADALHMVYLNPFEVQKQEQAAIDAGYVPPQVPVILNPEETSEYIMRNLDVFNYSPGVEKVKSELVQEFSLRNPAKTAMQVPAFFIHLNAIEVHQLSLSERVVSLTSSPC